MNEDFLNKIIDAITDNPTFCERVAREIEVDPLELQAWAEEQQDGD